MLVLGASCSDPFQTHPYDVQISGKRHINAENIAKIEEACAGKDTLRVAIISDTHLWQSDEKDELRDINRRAGIDFVIHLGDLTDTGTSMEFEWARDVLRKLKVPVVAMIGNHDFLGTGEQSYRIVFGDLDFSIIAGGVKFLCINTNATEYDYVADVPNLDYIEAEATRDGERFSRTVICMHAPPYSDQFNNNVCRAFRRYLDLFPGLMCCFYGHNHNDEVQDIYGDGLIFYGTDCASHRNYRILTITPDDYEVEQIFY